MNCIPITYLEIWCYILLGCTAHGLVFVRNIFRLVFYWHAFTCYREAADDPNSRASSQASRKDKEAGISAQLFNWWQFEEHKRWEKEKVMAVSSCCVFLFIPVPSLCGSCVLLRPENHCDLWDFDPFENFHTYCSCSIQILMCYTSNLQMLLFARTLFTNPAEMLY